MDVGKTFVKRMGTWVLLLVGAFAASAVSAQPMCSIKTDPKVHPAAGISMQYVLTAACSGQPTAYTWTGCGPKGDGKTCLATADTPGLHEYTLTASDAGGHGNTASLLVYWSEVYCSIELTDRFPVVGTSITMAANCAGPTTGFVWTNCASTTATCTATAGAPGSVSFTVAALTVNGQAFSAGFAVQWLSPGVKHVAVEFYHAVLDHYFITSDADETAKLDAGVLKGWKRTGLTFNVLPSGMLPLSVAEPVCRFYGDPAAGLDSHFYSAWRFECDTVRTFFKDWILESESVFQVFRPDINTGECAAGLAPVYRLWNNRVDSNHRYTTDMSVAVQMVAKGYVAEGSGSPPVAMCVLM